jgi:DNA-binding transcriptional regulator YiaG
LSKIDLKEARQTLGLSIDEAARACGVHRQTWVKWERAEREPDNAALNQVRLLLWLHEHRRATLDKWLGEI